MFERNGCSKNSAKSLHDGCFSIERPRNLANRLEIFAWQSTLRAHEPRVQTPSERETSVRLGWVPWSVQFRPRPFGMFVHIVRCAAEWTARWKNSARMVHWLEWASWRTTPTNKQWNQINYHVLYLWNTLESKATAAMVAVTVQEFVKQLKFYSAKDIGTPPSMHPRGQPVRAAAITLGQRVWRAKHSDRSTSWTKSFARLIGLVCTLRHQFIALFTSTQHVLPFIPFDGLN